MPFSAVTFAADSTKMRYREPFLTAGLNTKGAVNTAAGTYRGFVLSPNASANTVTITADADFSDHAAVYRTTTGFSLTINILGGDFSVDLTSIVDGGEKTWVLAIFSAYAVGAITVSELRAYELAPVDEFTLASEKPELVVLGTVVIPAGGGVISAASITPDRRSVAWRAIASDAIPWVPLVRNSSFEMGAFSDLTFGVESDIPYWLFDRDDSGDARWSIVTDTNTTTGSRALNFRTFSAAVEVSATMRQRLGVEAIPGQRLRFEFSKSTELAITSGTVTIDLVFKDKTGADTSTISESLDLSVADPSVYSTTERILVVPTGVAFLDRVEINLVAARWPSNIDAFRLDTIQVHLEALPEAGRDQIGAPADIGNLIIRDPNAVSDLLDAGTTLVYSSALNTLTLGKLTGSGTPGLVIPASIGVGGGIIDTDANARISRIAGVARTGAGIRTLITEFGAAAGKLVRHYVDGDGVLEYTSNARWDGGNWVKDADGLTAVRRTVSPIAATGMKIEFQEAGTNTWGDGAWTDLVFSTNTVGGDLVLAAQGNLTNLTLLTQLLQLESGVHGVKTLWIPSMAGWGGPASITGQDSGQDYVSVAAASTPFFRSSSAGGTKRIGYPLYLNVGDRILSVTCYAFVGNDASEELEAKFFRTSSTGVDTQIGSTKLSALGSTQRNVGWTTADGGFSPDGHVMLDEIYQVMIRLPQTSLNGEFVFWGIKITYDHP